MHWGKRFYEKGAFADLRFIVERKKKMERNEMELNPRAIAAYIDHTVLKPQASLAEVKKICEEAKEFRLQAYA